MGGRGTNRIHLVVVDHHVDGRSLRLRTATTTRRGFGGLGAPRRFFHHNTISFNVYKIKINPNSRISRSYKAAINGPDGFKWVISTKDEFYLLKDNHTWRIVRRFLRIYVLIGKWVFKIKE